jgi:uncharacterized protein YcnI
MNLKKNALLVMMILLFFVSVPAAWAHVTVYPREAAPGSYEKFTVRVPTESESPTVKVEIEIPEDVEISRVEPKAGWTYELVRDGNDRVSRVVWTADGPGLASTEFGEFNMQGRVGSNAERIVWKAYQTYGNGEVVEWIGGEDSDRPASVTTVKAPSRGDSSSTLIGQLTLILSIAAMVLSLAALILALRKRR